MIAHTIRMTMREDADPEKIAVALKELKRMGEEISSVESYVVGQDISDDYELGATFMIRGVDGYREYMYSPIHLNVDRIGLPLVKNMISFDITDDDDPAFREKIDEIHRSRYEDMEDIADLVDGLESYSGAGRD